MNAVVIYESLTGNTRRAAELIVGGLRSAGVDARACPVTNLDYGALAAADLVVVGTWVDGMLFVGQRPGRQGRLREMPVLTRKPCVVYCTYATHPGGTLKKMSKILEGRGANVLGGMAIHRGKLEEGAKDFVGRVLDVVPERA